MTTRVDLSEISHRCWRTDHNQSRMINWARETADIKHGENSIESIPFDDSRWLSILIEEVGEVAHAMTYDADPSEIPNELLDVLAVTAAWLDAYRVVGIVPQHKAWLAG